MKKWTLALLLGFLFTVALTGWNTFAEDYSTLQSSVVRLHILANSDSDSDQALKRKVRDAVLEETKDWFSGGQSLYETEQVLESRLDEIQEIARKTLRENGCGLPVGCALERISFDARQYDGFTMPAGTYDALRITIGKAEGRNWWCVLYPQLCLSAAVPQEELEAYFTPEEVEMLEQPQRYEIRWKTAEWMEKLKAWLEKHWGWK